MSIANWIGWAWVILVIVPMLISHIRHARRASRCSYPRCNRTCRYFWFLGYDIACKKHYRWAKRAEKSGGAS